jgi:parallel beta-helix repeat protein
VQRLIGSAFVGALLLVGAGNVVPASAQAGETVSCGETIDHSLTVANNIGPCDGDGLVVVASGITLDLGGHTVTGTGQNPPGGVTFDLPEQVGVHLMGVRGVTVRNGTIGAFDAGVVVEGGGGNTIQALYVHDNINKLRPDLPNPEDPQNPTSAECNFGDGITTSDSSGNRIQANRVVHNGPFSGISLVGNSDDNVVSANQVQLNNVPNVRADESVGPCGAPFSRPHQDIGIRIEGPGADRNRVQSNNVSGSELNGITIHGYVCHPPGRPPEPNNGSNVITANNVSRNGFAAPNETQDGIAILSQGPATVVCVAFGNTITGNISTANARHGIFVGGRGSHGNTISNNTVRNNGFGCTGPTLSPSGQPSCAPGDGVFVTGPGNAASRCGPGTLVSPCPGAVDNTLVGNQGSGNAHHDGHDANPNCDNNNWQRNRFGTVNQACVAAGGTGVVR